MADESEKSGQDEIEQLFAQAKSGAEQPESPSSGKDEEEPSLNEDEIEALLGSAGGEQPAEQEAARPATKTKPSKSAAAKAEQAMATAGDVEILLKNAEEALQSIDQPFEPDAPGLLAFELKDFEGTPPSADKATLELLKDVHLDLRIELGRTHMYLEDVLKLQRGSVVALDKLAGDPVDIFVNGRLIARGEILVLNDNFCVRIAQLVAGDAAA